MLIGAFVFGVNSAAEDEAQETYTWDNAYLVDIRNPLPLKNQLKEYLREEAVRMGISPDFAACIINAESGWRYDSKNPYSTAFGYGQFINSTYESTKQRAGIDWSRYNPYDQIDMFLWLLKEDGYTHWIVWPRCI